LQDNLGANAVIKAELHLMQQGLAASSQLGACMFGGVGCRGTRCSVGGSAGALGLLTGSGD